MNFILGISKKIKWKVETDVTRSIIDELHFSFVQGHQMEGESSVTRSIFDELLSLDIEGDQMEG